MLAALGPRGQGVSGVWLRVALNQGDWTAPQGTNIMPHSRGVLTPESSSQWLHLFHFSGLSFGQSGRFRDGSLTLSPWLTLSYKSTGMSTERRVAQSASWFHS